ncbi:SCP2 sterol-binding domain-containing protein [Nocardioides antri]|uniref:SCP2 domain-containing protein n=1 Tax=Nocardioides antri TaxID=2607659 RepID=A0A5B1M979_9ACTN|nr:SCP2 sterol-binding domain-containing protein [Nocardioides antri]KAA1429108.1 hypothetical protein F0U47_02600 [Nocardioides antri]
MGPVSLRALAHATADDVRVLLVEAEAAALVAAVRDASDAEVQAVVDRDEVRHAAIAAILGRLADFALPHRLAGLSGTARVDLEHGGRVVASEVLRVADGTITVVGADAAGGDVDVTLRTSVLGFVRLASGERNAGLEHLAGRLAIEGDPELALGLGGIFAAPGPAGAPPVAVDPRALDPVDVARELAHVDPDHLYAVLASGFRPVVLDEIFRRLPEFVNPRKAQGLRLVVGFRLSGRPDDQLDRFVVRLEDGAVEVLSGVAADAVGRDERSATVTCGAHDFLRLATGHLSPVTGVLRGQLKVRGDKAAALRLAGAFDIPTAVAG